MLLYKNNAVPMVCCLENICQYWWPDTITGFTGCLKVFGQTVTVCVYFLLYFVLSCLLCPWFDCTSCPGVFPRPLIVCCVPDLFPPVSSHLHQHGVFKPCVSLVSLSVGLLSPLLSLLWLCVCVLDIFLFVPQWGHRGPTATKQPISWVCLSSKRWE